MIVYDESGERLDSYDPDAGRVRIEEKDILHRWVVDAEEAGEYVTVAEYPETGGKDVEWRVTRPEEGHWETVDAESGEVVADYDGGVPEDLPHDVGTPDIWEYGVYVPYTAEELAQREEEAAKAEAAAERAKAIEERSGAFFVDGGKEEMERSIEEAASGGADPALAAFATLALPVVAPTARDSALAPVLKYAPAYVEEGHSYKKGEVFTYQGGYWRVSSGFTSQAQWLPGDAGLESQFYSIELAPDGVIVWAPVRGDFDAPDKGDLRHYPDAEGPVYRSLVDGNAYSPEAYPAGWEAA